MSLQERIMKKLYAAFAPVYLDVQNESHKHNVPPGAESHFKVVIVSDVFQHKTLVEQHRLINATLAEELTGGVHALAIQSKTPQQWETSGYAVRETPLCRGGEKAVAH